MNIFRKTTLDFDREDKITMNKMVRIFNELKELLDENSMAEHDYIIEDETKTTIISRDEIVWAITAIESLRSFCEEEKNIDCDGHTQSDVILASISERMSFGRRF